MAYLPAMPEWWNWQTCLPAGRHAGLIMPEWWNWQTRSLEGAVPKGVGVQLSPLAHKLHGGREVLSPGQKEIGVGGAGAPVLVDNPTGASDRENSSRKIKRGREKVRKFKRTKLKCLQ